MWEKFTKFKYILLLYLDELDATAPSPSDSGDCTAVDSLRTSFLK